ncbi:hypothetical protein ACHAXH_005529 [Discostella pseudostelligera]
MPTLRQVNIHPQTQERLSSGVKRKRSSTSSSSSGANNCIDRPLENSNAAAASASSASAASASALFVPIRTPSALLSRDPFKLSTDLNTSLHNIHTLRASVAREIISNPYSGHARHAADVAAGVTQLCCIDENDDDNDDQNPTIERQGKRILGSHQHEFNRPKPLLSGAITALDMCARARYIKTITSGCNKNNIVDNDFSNQQRSKHLDCIQTGSDAIDKLLAPGHSYSSFDDGWSMPHPFAINSNTDDEEYLTNRYSSTTSQSSCAQGVPFGMVTEFSGPPSSGKTQLALSIAAHAVMMNGLKVHYISGGNCRRAIARRLYTMFVELARSSPSCAADAPLSTRSSDEEVRAMALKKLDGVQISSVPDAYSLVAILARIDDEEISHQTDGEIAKNSDISNGTLLIIDSVSNCLGHHLASDAGAALASQVATTLRYLARTHDGHLHNSSCLDAPIHTQKVSKMMCQLRRFAVVVTNGSVVKRSFDNDHSHRFSASKHRSHNQPAMGQYWHVSDVGLWLEEDKTPVDDETSLQPISLYDNTPPVALSLAEKKIVRATLLNHYGKSCKCDNVVGQHSIKAFAKFSIRSSGISDL